jgi:hypothetical protein
MQKVSITCGHDVHEQSPVRYYIIVRLRSNASTTPAKFESAPSHLTSASHLHFNPAHLPIFFTPQCLRNGALIRTLYQNGHGVRRPHHSKKKSTIGGRPFLPHAWTSQSYKLQHPRALTEDVPTKVVPARDTPTRRQDRDRDRRKRERCE